MNDWRAEKDGLSRQRLSSEWVMLARKPEHLKHLNDWAKLETPMWFRGITNKKVLWTDHGEKLVSRVVLLRPGRRSAEQISEAVWDQGFRVQRLAVLEIPRSGPPDVLLDKYGISAKAIVAAVLAGQRSEVKGQR